MDELVDSVAIDGPAGSGKSSVAKRIAKAKGWLYVDTGAMYRAIAHKALVLGMNLEDEAAMIAMARATNIGFDSTGAKVLLDDADVSTEIRSPEVARNVKYAARVPDIRRLLVAKQQEMSHKLPVVMEGRDITTVVLPHARYKFFLTASPEVRAERRCAEMRAAGREVDLNGILEDIKARDAADYEVGPMKDARDRAMAQDGIVFLDTSDLDETQVVEKMLASMD